MKDPYMIVSCSDWLKQQASNFFKFEDGIDFEKWYELISKFVSFNNNYDDKSNIGVVRNFSVKFKYEDKDEDIDKKINLEINKKMANIISSIINNGVYSKDILNKMKENDIKITDENVEIFYKINPAIIILDKQKHKYEVTVSVGAYQTIVIYNKDNTVLFDSEMEIEDNVKD